MMSTRLLMGLSLLIFSGCSLQASKPAPVENISSSGAKPRYDRGSLSTPYYVVKKGDTLYSISWGAGKDFTEVARFNKLSPPYTIYPGQKLVLSNSYAKSTNNSIKTNANGVSTKAISPPYKTPDLSKDSKTVTTRNVAKSNKNKELTENKKVLDQQAKPAYSVTTTQQKINQTETPTVADLPDKVQKWYWPSKGKIIGYFSSNQQGNQGIKISGNRGDLIRSAAEGRVVYAGDALRGYGNLVIIKHNDDYLSAYAHTDKIMVKEKQYVNAGQTIATMGSTGASQVMLHFEIRYHGQSVNPLKHLPKQ